MKLSKSVYLVSGGYYGYLGNVYALRGERSVALIDCGQAVASENIERSLRYWGMGDMPITHVFITHGHHDHAGGAAYFQKKGAKIYCSALDAAEMKRGGMLGTDTPWGEGFEFPVCIPDVEFNGGDVLNFENFGLKVFAAPGHSAGSVFFQLQDGERDILFTGDSFSCDGELGDLIILGWKGSMDYSAEDFRKTLDMAFRNFSPDFILGGHGIPCVRDGKRVIRNAYRKYLLEYR